MWCCSGTHAITHTIPIERYGCLLHDHSEECSICLEATKGTYLALPCLHKFHLHCIEEWFKRARTCPLCQRKVEKIESTPSKTLPAG
jgi:hypothetical protein